VIFLYLGVEVPLGWEEPLEVMEPPTLEKRLEGKESLGAKELPLLEEMKETGDLKRQSPSRVVKRKSRISKWPRRLLP
jgi:hypothetical protein